MAVTDALVPYRRQAISNHNADLTVNNVSYYGTTIKQILFERGWVFNPPVSFLPADFHSDNDQFYGLFVTHKMRYGIDKTLSLILHLTSVSYDMSVTDTL